MSGYRIDGGLIDRNTAMSFRFDNKRMTGFGGDTLASALLANGVQLVGRSFKYHRPRGIFSAGSEEPNALVELREGAAQEPNTRATMAELYDGLVAKSQNRRGPLWGDVMGLNDFLSPWLGAGFYYKTFMWPKSFWEKIYEPVIRASAGLGRLSGQEDPDHYDKGFLHCDILIIGAGPAGLAAALTAGRSGAQVILADEDFRAGGRLLTDAKAVDGIASADWAAQAVAELDSLSNVRLMTRTTVYGAYDHGIYGALERKTDHLASAGDKPRQILWRIYSKRAILCAGATERSIAFGNNDRPGVMLSGAVRAYANRFGVACGQRVTVFTNNDDGWQTARALTEKGVRIGAVIDTRSDVDHSMNCRVIKGGQVLSTRGRHGLGGVLVRDSAGEETWIDTDCLAVSGGWSPNVHLTCHQRGRPAWRDQIAGFVPGGELPVGMSVAGAANGTMTMAACLLEGCETASNTLKDIGFKKSKVNVPQADDEQFAITPFWHVEASKARAWVDLQNDVTTKDIKQSQKEGFRAVEHLKRYTTLGMATDQGKTSNVLGLAIMAEATGKTIPETGTTIFRPPYSPVPIGAFAGRARGAEFRPVRQTFSHDWAAENGATFVEAGAWMRAQWYAQPGEAGWRDSVDREVLATRNSVGICDVTTLGKIDVQGRDAAAFMNKVYANAFGKLAVGKVRYGLMLREDGIVADDGTAARFSDTHFVITTTTANAGPMFRHMEFCRQCLWPDMDVHLISTTDQWAQFAVAGPNSRALLEGLVDDFDLSNEAFPFMGCTELTLCNGVPARLFRISFSGELAYEVAVPARYGDALARALMTAGEAFDVTPYGTEALSVMRIEKGHPVAAELNGTTTARDIGLGRMVSKKKDSIGNLASERAGLNREDGLALVGLRPLDPAAMLNAGAHFLEQGAEATTQNDLGWMTSVAYSPSLGHSIGLGFIKRGAERMGDVLRAYDPVRNKDTEVEIVSPHFIDPEGERVRA